MPYISAKDDRREKLRNGEPALTAGELNYQCFYFIKHNQGIINIKLIEGFVINFLGDKPNYQRYNDEIAKYEDTKIIENQDVE